MRRFMKIALITSSLLFLFCNNAQTEDWRVYSYFLNVTDLDADLNYIYVCASSGIFAIDKATDEFRTVAAFRKTMFDIPMDNLMADPYQAYNLYFTGRSYIYRYDWFNDAIYFCKAFAVKGKAVEKIGLNEDSVFIRIADKILGQPKDMMTDTGWAFRDNGEGIRWDADNKDFTAYPQFTPFKKIFNDKEYSYTAYVEDYNRLYVGTNGAGVVKLDKFSKEEKQYLYGLGSLNARAMALDSAGFIWSGGANAINITRFNPDKNDFQYFRADYYTAIPDNQIVYISASRKYVLFLTEYGQAFLYSLKENRFFPVFGEKGTILFRACPVDDSRFIVSNDIGIGMVDAATGEFTQINDRLTSVINVEYYNDTVYAVSQNTLYKAKLGDSLFSKAEFPFPTFIIYQYMKNDKAEILLDNAYTHIRMKGDTSFASYPNNLFGEFYDLAFDGERCFIASMDGFGIFPLKQKRWKIYDRKNAPLPSSGFYNVIPKDGFLYLNSQNGITRFYYTDPALND